MTENELAEALADRGFRLVHFSEHRVRAANDAAGADQFASSPQELLRRVDSWEESRRAAGIGTVGVLRGAAGAAETKPKPAADGPVAA